MNQYSNWSFEELRHQDYKAGRKSGNATPAASFGTQNTGGFGSAFGNNNAGTATSFGAFGNNNNNNNSTSAFGGNTGGFGNNSTTTSAFGAKPSGFGSAFGANNNTNTAGGLFGTNNNSTSAFGKPAGTSAFGQTNTNSAFGNTNTNTSAFGNSNSTSTGLFGNNTNTGGGGLFGNNTSTTQNKPLFGQTNTNTTGFGGGFGNTANNNTTSNSGGLFGGNTNNTGGGLFGNNASTTNTNSGGLFGGSTNNNATNTNGSAFGSAFGQKPASGGGLFGNNNAASTTTGGGLFGNTNNTNTNTTGGGLFGNNANNANKPATGGLFGNNTNTNTGGSLFGNTNNSTNTGSAFGSSVPLASGNNANTNDPNLGGTFARPNGTTSTFGSSATNTNSNNSGSLFGNKPTFGSSTATTGGGLFGNTNTSTNTGGGLFGNTANTNTSGGGLFGSTNNAATQQNQNQPLVATLTQNPYGNSQLFDTVKNSAQPEPLFVPVSKEPTNLKYLACVLGPRPLTLGSSAERSRSVSKAEKPEKPKPKVKKLDSIDPVFSSETDRLILMSEAFTLKESPTSLNISRNKSKDKAPLALPQHAQSSPPPKTTASTLPDNEVYDENGYWTSPSLAKLNEMSPNALSSVSCFQIGRKDCGFVEFKQPVDLSNYADIERQVLGRIVIFSRQEYASYPDDMERPPKGTGLNVDATVTLYNCYPISRDTKEPITQPDHPRLRKYIQKLEELPDTKFISYDRSNGTFVFSVPAV